MDGFRSSSIWRCSPAIVVKTIASVGKTLFEPRAYIAVFLRRRKLTLAEAARFHLVTEPPS